MRLHESKYHGGSGREIWVVHPFAGAAIAAIYNTDQARRHRRAYLDIAVAKGIILGELCLHRSSTLTNDSGALVKCWTS